MPIKKDHSELPAPARASGSGWKPNSDPLWGPILVDHLKTLSPPREPKQREYVSPSNALKCARDLSYRSAGVEGSPMDPSGWWVTSFGTLVHGVLEEAAKLHYGPEHVTMEERIGSVQEDGSVLPEIVQVRDHAIPVIGYIDYRIHSPELSLAGDFKTVGGFAYKLAVGERGQAQGPKREHLIQAGIGALVRGSDMVGVTYLAKDAISMQVARSKGFDEWQRFISEWHVPLDEIRTEVEDELIRMWQINRLVHEDGQLAARKIPGIPAEIASPKDGGWQKFDRYETPEGEVREVLVDSGSSWMCAYCSVQANCIADGPGRVEFINPKARNSQ